MSCDCNTFNPISEDAPHRLQGLEEARGVLLRVHETEGQCIAVFSWGAVSLPGEMVERLREHVGREMGILRLDGKFHIREVVASG
jgi:hypothetical protein